MKISTLFFAPIVILAFPVFAQAEVIHCTAKFTYLDGPSSNTTIDSQYVVTLDTAALKATIGYGPNSYDFSANYHPDVEFSSGIDRAFYFSFISLYTMNFSNDDFAVYLSSENALSLYNLSLPDEKSDGGLINFVIATNKKTQKVVSRLLYVATAPSGICI